LHKHKGLVAPLGSKEIACPQLLVMHLGRAPEEAEETELAAAAVTGAAATADPKEADETAGTLVTDEAAVVARWLLIPLSCTSNTKSALAGITGGDPAAPYPQAAEIRRVARSPRDICGTP